MLSKPRIQRDRVAMFALAALLLLVLSVAVRLLPSGSTLLCVAAAWVLFCSSKLAISPAIRLVSALGSATALTALAALEPTVWIALALLLVLCTALLGLEAWKRTDRILLGVGVLGPALLYGALYAAGSDARSALGLAFRVDLPVLELSARALLLLVVAALTATFIAEAERTSLEPRLKLWRTLAFVPLILLGSRLAWMLSLVTLRTDLLAWPEAPALLNLLKLSSGQSFYGPLSFVNSYSYSPGLELVQFGLLRPFQLALSLRAHRALGILWQLLSAAILCRGLCPWLNGMLRAPLGILAIPVLYAAVSCVVCSSFLSPFVHPDHLLMLCFCVAIRICIRKQPFGRRDVPVLLLVPAVATAFKLTGAGVGIGLVLAALPGRHYRALGVLTLAGVLALLTIPLFDRTLGSFSLYAIRLQASHRIEWERFDQLFFSSEARIFGLALLLAAGARQVWPKAANLQAAVRVLLLTIGFGALSSIAFLKQAGRENNLLPWAIGGAVALLVLFAVDPGRERTVPERLPSVVLVLALPWLALTVSWPIAPILGAPRRVLVSLHEREVSWLLDLFAHGKRPLAAGTAAWIDAGRRDPPFDSFGSASELDFGHWAAVQDFEQRLLGSYDGVFVPSVVLADNALFVRLRPKLVQIYRVAEPPAPVGVWPETNRTGYVILERCQSGCSGRPAFVKAVPRP